MKIRLIHGTRLELREARSVCLFAPYYTDIYLL